MLPVFASLRRWPHGSGASKNACRLRRADMCSRDVLSPDAEMQCRYRIRGTDIHLDVLSPEGFNVGGVNPWFARAAEAARPFDVGAARTVMAVTPPYFLATKLVAFEDRGPNAQSSKDVEDIVTLAVEVSLRRNRSSEMTYLTH
jgi:hypothetical protein